MHFMVFFHFTEIKKWFNRHHILLLLSFRCSFYATVHSFISIQCIYKHTVLNDETHNTFTQIYTEHNPEYPQASFLMSE